MPSVPRERTRTIARQVPNTAQFIDPSLAGSISGALGDFFGGLASIEQEKQQRKVAAQTDAALKVLHMQVMQDPESAREAVRTGDYTKFVPQEVAAQNSFVTKAPEVVGEALGFQDVQDFRTRFRALKPTDNGNRFFAEYIKANTQGMNPLGAAAYSKSIEGELPKLTTERSKAAANLAKLRITEAASTALPGLINNGELPSIESFNSYIASVAGSMAGTPITAAMVDTRDILEQRLVEMYWDENTSEAQQNAIDRLLFQKDPVLGTSIFDRQMDNFDAIRSRLRGRTQAKFKERFFSEIRALDVRLNGLKLGVPAQEDDSLDTWAADFHQLTNHGDLNHPQAIELFKKFQGVITEQAEDNVVGRLLASGRVNEISDKARNSHIKKELEAGNRGQALDAAAQLGPSPELQQQWSNGLAAGDPQVVLETHAEVASVHRHPDNNRSATELLGGDQRSLALFWALDGADAASAPEIIDRLNQGLKRNGGKVEGAFENTLRESEGILGADSTRARFAARGKRDFLQEMLEDTPAKVREALGVAALPDSISQLPREVRTHLERMTDIAALSASVYGGDKFLNYVRDGVLKLVKGDFEYIPQSDGTIVPIMKRTKPVTKTATGEPIKQGTWSKQDAETWQKASKELWPEVKLGMLPIAETEDTGIMMVTLDNDTSSNIPAVVDAGRPLFMDEDLINGPFKDIAKVRSMVEGTAVVEFPVPHDKSRTVIPVGPHVFAEYSPEANNWTLKAYAIGEFTTRNQTANSLIEGGKAVGITPEEALSQAPTGVDPGTAARFDDIKDRAALLRGIPDMSDEELNSAFEQSDGFLKNLMLQEMLKRGTREETGVNLDASPRPGQPEAAKRFLKQMNIDVPQRGDRNVEAESKKLGDQLTDALVSRGQIPPTAGAAGKRQGRTLQETLETARTEAQKMGSPLDDLLKPTSSELMMDVLDFVEVSEGFAPRVYGDLSNDQPTIGFGYFLGNPGARERLEEMGLDPEKVLRGEQAITREQAARLSMDHVVKLATFIKKHFKGVPLRRHQIKALISLGYSSRWHQKPAGYQGPTLIGPKLTKAVREGDIQAASFEIEHNSISEDMKRRRPDIIRGLQNRRTREALMFRGVLSGD